MLFLFIIAVFFSSHFGENAEDIVFHISTPIPCKGHTLCINKLSVAKYNEV